MSVAQKSFVFLESLATDRLLGISTQGAFSSTWHRAINGLIRLSGYLQRPTHGPAGRFYHVGQ